MSYFKLGLKRLDQYTSKSELDNDTNNGDAPVTDGKILYLLWQKPVKSVKVEIVPPICGNKIERKLYSQSGKTSSFYTDPAPEIKLREGSEYVYVFRNSYYSGEKDALWIDNPEGNISIYGQSDEGKGYLNGEIKGESIYYVYCFLQCKFGNYLGTLKNNNITINGKKPTYISDNGAVVGAIPALHNQPKDAQITPPTCEEYGTATYTCSGCNKKIEDKQYAPPTGHAWEFTGFNWTTNKKDGIAKAVAQYICKNDAKHSCTCDAAIDKTETAAKGDAGRTVDYTATVSAADSPDGKKHTDKMSIEITESSDQTNKTWGFKGFTWTGSDEKGYTKAVAIFTCKEDVHLNYSIEARLTKEVTGSNGAGEEQTIYTAFISKNDSPDGADHSEIKKVNKDTGQKTSGLMFAKVVPKGKSNLKFTWSKVNGAQGYDIYIGRSNFDGNAISCQLQKTIKGNRRFHWTKKKLRKHTYYKAYVKAWIMKNGKKETIRKSIYVRTITSGANKQYTAPRNITVKTTKLTLKSGETHKIHATISKYKKKKKKSKYLFGVTYKTSNDKIASVDKNGKITAKSSGNCKVYAIAANGARKTIHVTVEQ